MTAFLGVELPHRADCTARRYDLTLTLKGLVRCLTCGAAAMTPLPREVIADLISFQGELRADADKRFGGGAA